MIKLFFFAAIDLSSFGLNLAVLEVLVGVILFGLAAMWVVRKLMFIMSVDWEHDPDYGGDGEGYD